MNSLLIQKTRSRRRGIALVSVLVIVVLLTAVILGFLVTSKQEQVASRSYKASSSARQMADTAVNLVQGQINQATSQGMNYAWASQPGAIRVYGPTTTAVPDPVTGLDNQVKIYKLYSAQNLTTVDPNTMDTEASMDGGTTTSPGDSSHPDMPPGNWSSDTAVWVDLNAPVSDAGGNSRFPIFDQSKAANVDGFSIDTNLTKQLGVTSTSAQQAPMPVRWLYVLQNGQIIAPDTTSTGTVLFFKSASVAPSTANPIVGRIAFWTDDETCKVNINTAGGDGIGTVTGTTSPPTIDPTPIANATFWDTPHFNSIDDVPQSIGQPAPLPLATSQPAQGEFQRYPGHPATVALKNILSGLGWGFSTTDSTDFYSLLPRYTYGGSKGATVPVMTATSLSLKGSPANHLYSSVAEMLFNYDRTHSSINPTPSTSATQEQIETARFFLTAHSRAPEVTLFGQPRVSIWPEIVTTNEHPAGDPLGRVRTAIDNLLAFCATISGSPAAGGGNEYYFTRYDPTSCSNDISIARNVTLLKYLDYFTSQTIPGYGGNFATKYNAIYSQGMRQILTEIFDYIRTINIADNVADTTIVGGGGTPKIYAQPWFPVSLSGFFSGTNAGGLFEVAPSLTNNSSLGWGTQGIGIYPRLNEVAIQFVAMGQGASPTPSPSGTAGIPPNPVYGNTPSGPNGDSGPGIFGVGDTGTNPFKDTNPYMTDTAWEAAGYGNDPITFLPTSTTIQEVVADVNQVIQDKRQFFDPADHPPIHPNPNYLKWFVPGNTVAGSKPPTMAVQAFLLLSFINPSQMMICNGGAGAAICPGVWVKISGLGGLSPSGVGGGGLTPFGATGVSPSNYNSLGFPDPATMFFYGNQATVVGATWDTFQFYDALFGRHTSQVPSPTWAQINPFYSKIIPIAINATSQLYFSGGTITVTLYDGGGLSAASAPGPTLTGSPPSLPSNFKVVQTYTITFPGQTFPLPTFSPSPPSVGTPAPAPAITYPPASGSGPSVGIAAAGDRWTNTSSYWYDSPNCGFILMGDVVQSMVLGNSANPTWTDARMLAASTVPALGALNPPFSKHPYYGNQAFAYNFLWAQQPYYSDPNTNLALGPQPHVYPPLGTLNKNVTSANGLSYTPAQIVGSGVYVSVPDAPPTLTAGPPNVSGGIVNTDWDNGIGPLPDGPWVNKADEGTIENAGGVAGNQTPYFGFDTPASIGPSFFSPNREVPSPGMFGSLPTGIDPTGNNPTPWQTLLFRPCPGHEGEKSPKDHLLLDLFWMPVAEPYAISEPFSTAGKINLNYQIEPFTYITRSTAIRAVLNPEKIAQLSATGSENGKPNGTLYKVWALGTGATGLPLPVRRALDVNQTLRQFDDKFNGASGTPDIFHSASQICEMYLVPQGETQETFEGPTGTWYDGKSYGLVGDNVRERPYANIYGQITTKSNTYTVYYTVQSLKNADKDQTEWDENQGVVLGEYRGSTTLERYIDPNQTFPKDFATNPGTAGTLDGDVTNSSNPSYYRWRVVDNHPFAP